MRVVSRQKLVFLGFVVLALWGCKPTMESEDKRVIQSGTATLPTQAADVLEGTQFWDPTGTLQTGTMTNQGILDLDASSIPSSSAGYYSSITTSLTNADVCADKNLFGSVGTALCVTGYADLAPSLLGRNVGTTQMTLADETSGAALPSNYRDVPVLSKDNDGDSNSHSPLIKATRPTVNCGYGSGLGLDTIAKRIEHCQTANPTTYLWTGATKGIAGEGDWKLVTRIGSDEVWQDQRTGLIWSAHISTATNWCIAAGNVQTDDLWGYCNPTHASTVQPNSKSACYEGTGLSAFLGTEDFTIGTYGNQKGGMGKIGTSDSPSIIWRLPTRSDWWLAFMNGARAVLPVSASYTYWTATVKSTPSGVSAYQHGYTVNFNTGTTSSSTYRNSNDSNGAVTVYVRCVGRPGP